MITMKKNLVGSGQIFGRFLYYIFFMELWFQKHIDKA